MTDSRFNLKSDNLGRDLSKPAGESLLKCRQSGNKRKLQDYTSVRRINNNTQAFVQNQFDNVNGESNKDRKIYELDHVTCKTEIKARKRVYWGAYVSGLADFSETTSLLASVDSVGPRDGTVATCAVC